MANILIVEDEKNMQEIITEYMRRGGHTCYTADDGVDALMVLKNNPMDLMILDIMMPLLDGFSVCKMAREMSNIPIIMLTAKGGNSNTRGAYTKTVSKTTSSNGAEAKLQMVLECYQDSNNRRINKIKPTKWIAVSGSILECEYTSYISDKNDQGVGTKARMFGTVKMEKGSDSNIWTSIDHTYSLD